MSSAHEHGLANNVQNRRPMDVVEQIGRAVRHAPQAGREGVAARR